ncbi:pyridoxamine 5'-phosphate oxidase family protein [Jiulongibacter sediminis]|jgi:nitroimidazol reductase NimA-like FMN-containing flavoprotein (pyridoxamine 5'-phosphate oxidase superfamily)|uniref:pyridoxamine 5'-phosphate oxidase family protein n=1 Tax=Jiulongibacter sediminis TaxID=1605367 RepID=UPI0026EDA505|nr:pyridoxamine 5'-phosphate oxidase family protein [Jiulongibacter sediminis]
MSRKTKRTTPSRMANQRAHYSDENIYEILDEALFCTISYAEDNQPFSIPQSFVRIDNYIYLHASVGSHFVRKLTDGRPVCITVMLADDLVVAKTAFHHSVNYRSVVIFAKGEEINDNEKKYEAFKVLTEKMVPGSWDYLKPMSQSEINKTTAIRFSLDEASAKIRRGAPSHEEDEMDLPIWTGLIPIKPLRQQPVADEHGAKIPLPDHLKY